VQHDARKTSACSMQQATSLSLLLLLHRYCTAAALAIVNPFSFKAILWSRARSCVRHGCTVARLLYCTASRVLHCCAQAGGHADEHVSV